MSSYETIILGSSANALAAAAYLARAGRSVLVLESSPHLGGGAMSTVSLAEGFQADLGLMSGRLDESIVKDLKLAQHGLEQIERKTITSLLPDGRSFTLSADQDAAAREIAKFAASDAARYEKFMQLLNLAADLLKSAYAARPAARPATGADQTHMAALVGQLRGYGAREMTEVLRLLVMSVRHMLDEWFENAELKGLLGSLGVRGLTQGPFAGGTTFNLLHHLCIGDGYFRATARGGLGALAGSLGAAAKELGVKVQINAGDFAVLVKDGQARGVKLASGEEIEAINIISDYDARYTFRQLVEPSELEPEFNRAVGNIRYNGAVARVNLALNAVPRFEGLSEEALRGTLISAGSLAYLERAFDDAKYGGISKAPYLEVTIPSLSDASVAPAGKHLMSIWMQYAPYRSKLTAQAVQELVIAQISKFAPDLSKHVLASQVMMPADYESQFHLSEGHLYGGEMTLNQAFYLRPVPGFAQYQTPIENLYLCGAATHPGGGISGLSGRNAANELKIPELALSV